LAVVSAEWEVVPAGTESEPTTPQEEEAAAHLRQQLEAIDWDGVTDQMLWALFYGFAVAEAVYNQGPSGKTWLTKIAVRKQRRFRFAPDGSPLLITKAKPEGEAVDPAKFWVVSTGSDNSDDPYGQGLAAVLYWPVTFKRQGLKFWLNFLETFAQPGAQVQYPVSATQAEKDKALELAAAIANGAKATAIPEGLIVELIEAKRSGTADYATILGILDRAIAKVVLSQTMTTDDGSSYSQAQTHKAVRDEVVKADADLINESFNQQVVAPLTFWNFGPGVRPPKVWRRVGEKVDLKLQAETDKLVAEQGWERTEESIRSLYGEGWVRKAAVPGSAPMDEPPAPSFAEGRPQPPKRAQDAIDLFGAQLADRAGPLVDGWVAQIQGRLNSAASLPEFAETLYGLFPDMPSEDFVALMETAMAAARVAGAVEADADAE
jgi:phage gp29-like protein